MAGSASKLQARGRVPEYPEDALPVKIHSKTSPVMIDDYFFHRRVCVAVVKCFHHRQCQRRKGYDMNGKMHQAAIMRKIAYMARKLGLKLGDGALHPGAVWCETTGGKPGCCFILDENVNAGVWGKKWTAAVFFNGETKTTRAAFIKTNHLGAAFAVWLDG